MDPWLIYVLSGRFVGEVYICTIASPASLIIISGVEFSCIYWVSALVATGELWP